MPSITITDYSWRQTPEQIIITVSIVGRPKNVNVFAIDNYVKASYPPFILELFLWENILEEASECTLGDSSAVFTLMKAEKGREWPSLVLDGLSRDKKREYRSQAVERARLSEEKRVKEKNEKRQELQRLAVKKQIEVDTQTLNKIEVIRDGHRKDAMVELEAWRENSEKPMFNTEKAITQHNRKPFRAPLNWFKNKSADPMNLHETDEVEHDNSSYKIQKGNLLTVETEVDNEIILRSSVKNTEDRQRGKEIIEKLVNGKFRLHKEKKLEDTDIITPKPRKCGEIRVQFSERIFPTPARESHYLEEQEWLHKQADARRKCGFASEDLRPEEQDPQWLKDKGDEFFQVGNYLAAVSAYTHGIRLSDKMASLYANRSAAQYALNNYKRCAEDCSTALELMLPKCEGNRESRARCHARLGAALCKLSAPQHGIPELEAALELAPDNDTIKRDLDEARQYFHV